MTDDVKPMECPYCKARNIYRNGHNKHKSGAKIQRWFCNECDRTFQMFYVKCDRL
ncbi:IS1 family transposase [Aulosira sp. FACHB-113]|uniref:IS1 family transposase n=1 Tax=Tolypothrix tenuis TaxID=457083 RepID=UPI001684A4D4|nr:IS1 family transposase [Aulosira sp. FACHB-113]